MTSPFRRIAIAALCTLALPVLCATSARAWGPGWGPGWHPGWRPGCCTYQPRVVIGVPAPVIVVPPPVAYRPVWVPAHWYGPSWVPGHWR